MVVKARFRCYKWVFIILWHIPQSTSLPIGIANELWGNSLSLFHVLFHRIGISSESSGITCSCWHSAQLRSFDTSSLFSTLAKEFDLSWPAASCFPKHETSLVSPDGSNEGLKKSSRGGGGGTSSFVQVGHRLVFSVAKSHTTHIHFLGVHYLLGRRGSGTANVWELKLGRTSGMGIGSVNLSKEKPDTYCSDCGTTQRAVWCRGWSST
jgi:hypothetical protein